jgi:hypothetical protein
MRLPKFIYEMYPILYIVGGIAAMSMIDSQVCFLCGLILGTGGVAILFMRRNYRLIQEHLAQIS